MVKKARAVNDPLSLTALNLGLLCSHFQITLLALLILLYLTNRGILGMTGLKILSFAKDRILFIVAFTFSWLLMVLRGTLALKSSTGDTFLSFSFILTLARRC
jgi:hypothetical protein